MRLTLPLHKESLSWLIKNVRKRRMQLKIPQGYVPDYAQEAGVEVVNANKLFNPAPRFTKWEPPESIRKDPQFGYELAIEEHKDYHERPIYQIVELSHLIEGMKQVEILTNTQVINHLPDQINGNLDVVRLPRQDELVQRYIMQANVWDPTKVKIQRWRLPETPRGWKFKAETGIPKRKTNSILVQNMLRLCESIKAVSADLSTRTTTRNHPISTFYDYKSDKRIQIKSSHNFMVSNDHIMPPFASEEQVAATGSYTLPDLYPVEPTIDIHTTNIYKEENTTGWMPGSRLMYPHTVIHNHRDYWTASRKNAKALFFCFANCLAVAKMKYGPDVKVLPEPITMQWIGADLDTLHFICYQLNTLDFSSDDNDDSAKIKNIAWMDTENKLYNKILPKRAMLRSTKYEDYDPEVFQKFLAFYLTDCNVEEIREKLDKREVR